MIDNIKVFGSSMVAITLSSLVNNLTTWFTFIPELFLMALA